MRSPRASVALIWLVAACEDANVFRPIPTGAAPSDAAAPGADGSTGAAPSDGGARTYSLASLPDDLVGYWDLGETIGNCIDTEQYLSFFADGSAESILVDDDACYPEDRGLFITPAVYALDGRSLTFTTPTTVERDAVAVGERFGQRRLCRRVFLPVEPLHWQSIVELEVRDGEQTLVQTRTQVDLFFGEPPSLADARGTAELRYEVTSRDERLSLVERDRSAVDVFPGLTWGTRPDPYDPALTRIEVAGDLTRVFGELFTSSTVGEVLSFGSGGFALSFDPAQPDFLDSGFCLPGLPAPPAVLRR
jgi:hypothetical protein